MSEPLSRRKMITRWNCRAAAGVAGLVAAERIARRVRADSARQRRHLGTGRNAHLCGTALADVASLHGARIQSQRCFKSDPSERRTTICRAVQRVTGKEFQGLAHSD